MERCIIILEHALSVPPADCTQESGWWNAIAHNHSSAKQLLFPPSPTENTLATHTNFTNKKIGPRRKEGFSPKFKLVLFSHFYHLCWAGTQLHFPFLHFRGCGISEQVEQGTEGGTTWHPDSSGFAVPRHHWEPGLERPALRFESPAPEKHTHIQNHRLKLVLIWFSLPPLISLAKPKHWHLSPLWTCGCGKKICLYAIDKRGKALCSINCGRDRIIYTAFVSHWER